MKMIRYILGKTGAGKTKSAYSEHLELSNSIFFGSTRDHKFPNTKSILLDDKMESNILVNTLPKYREHLNNREEFNKIVLEKIVEAMALKPDVIFLDDFQSYATKELAKIILESHISFQIIHQWPEQIPDNVFTSLWEQADEKFLLNPYPSPYYSV